MLKYLGELKMMTVVAIIVMAAALVGMIYCAKSRKKTPMRRNMRSYALSLFW
jgi:hypothetical protein